MAKKPTQKSTIKETTPNSNAENDDNNNTVDKKTEIKKIIIACGIIVIIVLVMTIILALPLLTGTTVILKTLPVDPMDPLRGQYMTIRYEIGDWDTDAITKYPAGTPVFVEVYKTTDGIWAKKAITTEKPKEGIFLKGTIENNWRSSIHFGIEQYFFEKNAIFPTNNITVEAKVDSNGNARIVQLLQNGKPVEIKYQEQGWMK